MTQPEKSRQAGISPAEMAAGVEDHVTLHRAGYSGDNLGDQQALRRWRCLLELSREFLESDAPDRSF